MTSHAYIIFGNHDEGLENLRVICDPEGKRCLPLDFFIRKSDSGTVDDVRIVRDEATKKPLVSEIRMIVLSVGSLHEEAQQMLLKTFEEPAQDTIVALILPRGARILPTLISRAKIIHTTPSSSKNLPFSLNAFLQSSPKERITLVESIFDEENEEVTTKTQALALLEEIEKIFLQKAQEGNGEALQVISDVEHVRPFILQKGGVPKYIMEYLASTLPKR